MKTLALLLCLAVPAFAQTVDIPNDAPHEAPLTLGDDEVSIMPNGSLLLSAPVAIEVAKELKRCDAERAVYKKYTSNEWLIFAAVAGALVVGLGGGIAIGYAAAPKR